MSVCAKGGGYRIQTHDALNLEIQSMLSVLVLLLAYVLQEKNVGFSKPTHLIVISAVTS